MTWRTHMAVGSNAVWLAALQPLDGTILLLLGVAAVASLLPDIDTGGGAKIHYAGGGALGVFRGLFGGKYFHHRGLMHSFLVTGFLFTVVWFFFRDSVPLLPYVFALAYVSHPAIDGFNADVGYLYPFTTKKFAFVPRVLRSRVKGPVDTGLMFLGLFGLALFFLLHMGQFVPGAW